MEEFVTIEEASSAEEEPQIDSGGTDAEEEEMGNLDDETEEVLVMTKNKVKDPSPVWANGAVLVKNGIKCQFCGKVYSQNYGNTSNIMQHILNKHSNLPEGRKLKMLRQERRNKRQEKTKAEVSKRSELIKLKQSSLKTFCRKQSIDMLRKKKIEHALLKYIIVENKPFDTVEKHAFREMPI